MSNKEWTRIEEIIKQGSIDTVNTKIVINDGQHEHDLYVKVGYTDSRWVWVDLTLSRYSGQAASEDENPRVAELRRELTETTRRLLEIACVHATELVQSDERTLLQIVDKWKGRAFEPAGVCDSVKTDANEIGRVMSPLDAAAKIIELKLPEWERRVQAEV